MDQASKIRENRLRNMAKRRGLELRRSRRRDTMALDYGGYMLVDIATNSLVAGGSPIPFSLTMDDVEAWLTTP